MAIIKTNKDALEPNPNAGAKNISNKGRVHPMIIQAMCFFILLI